MKYKKDFFINKSKKAFSLIELSIVLLIIGIIAGGITQSSRLIAAFKLSSARSLTRGSPVASISGLVAWWDATSEASFKSSEADDGSKISTWYDINPQSSSKNDLTQATLAKKPIYTASAINGLPALSFDGSAQYLGVPYSADFNASQFTIFAVVRPTAYNTAYGPIVASRDYETMGGYVLYAANTGHYQFVLGNSSSWVGLYEDSPASITFKKADVLTGSYDGTTRKLYASGTLSLSGSASLTTNQQKMLTIGVVDIEAAIVVYYYTGYVGEVIIFNRNLKVSERTDVENYLQKKWSVR